jgi:hypothetical protein
MNISRENIYLAKSWLYMHIEEAEFVLLTPIWQIKSMFHIAGLHEIPVFQVHPEHIPWNPWFWAYLVSKTIGTNDF